MNESLPKNKKRGGIEGVKKRSLASRLGCFLSKNGLVRPMKKVFLNHKRRKKASGTGLLLQSLFSFVFLVSSIYSMKASPLPKNLLKKFGVQRFCPKTSFYREICNLNLGSLERFTDELSKKMVGVKSDIIVTLDPHPIKVWSRNYANAAWGASSCGTFFGYKLFAAILHGTDIVVHHLLAPANYNELDFGFWQVEQVLQKLGKIDVLLMDRGYFSFEFFSFLIQKSVGFVTVAKVNIAAIQPYLRSISNCFFHDLDENTCYHEALIFFPELRRNLRVIFVRRFVGGEMREYELITNLSEKYSAGQIIRLYSKRQGREDVFDRLKNELRLHKPCKIKNFSGIQAFVALTITAYNIYTSFSHGLCNGYVTIRVLFRCFLFGFIPKRVERKTVIEEIPKPATEAERYQADSHTSLFHA